MKQKLLIISMHFSTGGMPRYILEQVKNLIDIYEIFIIEYSYYGDEFVTHRNQIIDIIGKNFYSLPFNKTIILDLIDKIDPDIIHIGELPEMFMDNEIAKKIYSNDRRYKIIATTHDSSWNINNIVYLPDHFIFVSKYSQQQFEPLGVPSSVVLYPIEYKNRPDRTETLLKLGLDPNLKHVLNVGIFTERKNQGELIEYARKVQDYPIQFHFIGSLAGNFKYYWESLINDKPNNCIMWGERGDVDVFYSCMDLFVFTSCARPGDTETNPLVIREATSWHMPFLMYNLDVYQGMYDEYVNIKYLTQDKDENLKMILNELKINKPIYIFSHNYLVNNWEEIFTDQLLKLLNSYLYSNADKIFFGVYSPIEYNYLKFTSILAEHDIERKISVVKFEENLDEFTTLSFLQNTICDLNFDVNVLYYHLKGVTSIQNHSDVNVTNEAVTSWRNVMEYFLIEKWYNCIEMLYNYDSVGCFWNDENHEMYPNMYCGNFWWSKSSHIKNLPKINDIVNDRMNAERWIGMKDHIWFNMKSPTLENNQLYEAVWKPEDYRDDYIKAIHLLTLTDTDREIKSIDSISQIQKNKKIIYQKNVNDVYVGYIPINKCARPDNISIYPGDNKLTPAHYGCYLSHREAILSNINKNYSGLLIFECDSILTVDVDIFLKHVKYAEELCTKYDLVMFSFGYNFKQDEQEYFDDYCITNSISDITECHSYFIPKKSYHIFKDIFDQPWDVTDILYTRHLKGMRMGNFTQLLTRQTGGTSLLDQKEKNMEQDKMYNENPIFIFSHNYLVNNWKKVVTNQLTKLVDSGLYDYAKIYYYAYCEDNNAWIDFVNLIKKYDVNDKIILSLLYRNNYEFDVLNRIYDFCINYNGNGRILYYHTKGVVSEHDENNNKKAIISWRNKLEETTITNWKHCVDNLDTHDIVGPFYFGQNPDLTPIFAGNFWWTNISYVKKLKRIDDTGGRGNCENWITSIPHKPLNLYSPKDLNLYQVSIEKNIAVFSHNYLVNDWKYIVEEQLYLLESGNLYEAATDIYMTYYAPNEQEEIDFLNIISKYPKIKTFKLRDNNFEFPTLHIIKKYCDNKPETKICYYHTKGASNKARNMETWRKYINHFIITKWKTNVEALNNNDVSFVDDEYNSYHNLTDRQKTCGNFWWANSSYIKTLKEVDIYDEDRFNAELWILSNSAVRKCSIFESGYVNEHPFEYLYAKFYSPYFYRIDHEKFVDEIYWSSNKYFSIQQKEKEWKDLLLYILNNDIKTDNALEIGRYNGGTTNSLCQLFDNVVSIDIERQPNIDFLEEVNQNLTIITADSKNINTVELIKSFDKKFNLIFIDGDHSYEGVKKDLELYNQFLSPDGIILFHDIIHSEWHTNMNCGVPELWDELKNKYNTHEIISTDRNEITDINSYNDILKSQCEKYEQFGGIGILTKAGRLNHLLKRRRMLLDYLDTPMTNDFDTLLGLKEIADEFLNKNSVMAEIGSYAGVSSELFALHCKIIYCIDPWEYNGKEDFNSFRAENEFDNTLSKNDNMFKIKDTSDVAVNMFEDSSLDLVYIDGCHDYECVLDDINNWLPKVKDGGVISGHDYHLPQVKNAVDKFFNNIKTYQDNSWLVKIDRNNSLNKKRIPWFDEVGGTNTLHGLDELCKDFIKPGFIMAEIGSYAGVSSELFSNYCKHITCIDPWVEYGEMNSDEISNGEKLFDSMIKDKNNITKLKRYSGDAINYFKDDYFDLIYIDASHEYNDVKYDITYWLPKIKTNGIISGHDYNNENVKRAIHDTIGLNDIKVYSDSSWAKKINIVNVEKPIYIFSHNYLVYNWEEILKEQLTGIILNELYTKSEKIYYCVYSESELDYNKFLFLITIYDYLHKIEIVRHEKNDREYHTLMLIKKFSNDIGKDVDILYYHMKGVFSGNLEKHNKETVTKWRKYLEYFNIEKWRDCVEQLKTYDTVGCLYINMWFEKYGESRMYAGNFWWSHSNYIKNLPDLNLTDIEEWPMHLETWISKNPDPHSWYNFYTDVQKDTWDFYTYFPDESVWKDKKEDSICVVTSHPNYRATEETTIKCIESLKATGRKVILGTHCKISDKLNDVTDYHVFDENNPMIKHNFYNRTWFDTEDYHVELNLHKFDNDNNHAIACHNNMFSGIKKAKELGYKYAIVTNFDLIFTEKDYHVFDDKIKQLKETDKKAYFMNTNENEGWTLKTIFFITEVDFYLEHLKYFKDESEYNEEIKRVGSETNCLENLYFNILSR